MELYKHKNHRNLKYLAWLRRQKCVVSNEPAQVAHHIRLGTNGGQALKPSDYFCFPLTDEFHTNGQNAVHRIGEETFLRQYNLDKISIFIRLMSTYMKEVLEVSIPNSEDSFELIELLIEKLESFNQTRGVSKKSKSKKQVIKNKPKLSITEDQFYQKAKELKRKRDKELRDEIKLNKSKQVKPNKEIKAKPQGRKLAKKSSFKDNEFYKAAKEIQKEYSKKKRAENKEQQAEYRKKMYKKAKEQKKLYEAQRKDELE